MSTFDLLSEERDIMKEQISAGSITIDKDKFFGCAISDIKLKKAQVIDSRGTIEEAVMMMQNFNIGSIVVVQLGKVVGILTERDILMKVAGKKEENNKLLVADFMTKNPVCLRPNDAILYVMNNMHLGRFRHIPIVDEAGAPLFMISVRDVLNYFLNGFNEEISNTQAEPFRGIKDREVGG